MNDNFDNQQPGQQAPQYQPYSTANTNGSDYRPDGNNAGNQNNAWQTGYQVPYQPYNTQPFNQSSPQQQMPQQPYGYQPVQLYDPSGKAVVGFVLGLVGIIAWFLPIAGYPVTIVGLVMSYRGMKSSKRSLAIAGMILCIIFLIATVIDSILGAAIMFKSIADR